MSKPNSYSRIRSLQDYKLSVLHASQARASTRNQYWMLWKHPSVSEQWGNRSSQKSWQCNGSTLRKGFMRRWNRGCGRRHVRETCFNTPGRQNSSESGWKMKGGETGQKCVPLYEVFLSSSGKGPLLLCSAGSIWKEPDVGNCTPVIIRQTLSDDDQ